MPTENNAVGARESTELAAPQGEGARSDIMRTCKGGGC
jgi:hypothetical protein